MTPAAAEETTAPAPVVLGSAEANKLLENKTVETPTLDYLNQNNIKISQKTQDESGNEVETLVKAPDSAYTITKLTDKEAAKYEATPQADRDRMVFKYTTADAEGNLTNTYYRASLRQGSSDLQLGTSKNITWSETKLKESDYTATGSFDLKVSDTETKTYYYGYTKPSGYDIVEERINDTLSADNVTNKTFIDTVIVNGNNNMDINIVADFIITNIHNSGKIGNITGDFINNDWGSSTDVNGGAIDNDIAEIGNITGDFIGNTLWSSAGSEGWHNTYGGAISNVGGKIGNITGSFISNSLNADADAYGGAIYNSTASLWDSSTKTYKEVPAVIGNITGNFINNLANGYLSNGGAICNQAYSGTATIGDITGNFINNSANGSQFSSYGGAIRNGAEDASTATIGNITGDYIGNSLTFASFETSASSPIFAEGGAISNRAEDASTAIIGNITGDFINNSVNLTNTVTLSGSAETTGPSVHGGAIANYADSSESTAVIGNITGNFIGNSINTSIDITRRNSSQAIYKNSNSGGAIYNNGSIGSIAGDYINNSVTVNVKDDIRATWNRAHARGGAIANEGVITSIKGNFINNSATGNLADGGAIYNSGTIDSIVGNFINNTATSNGWHSNGGAISNKGTIKNITGNFINNSTEYHGGAIYNEAIDTVMNITNSSFINNSVVDCYDIGGAIHNEKGTINIDNSYFASNNAGEGGAIYNKDIMTIKNSVFENNSGEGGAIQNNGSELTISDSVFRGNHNDYGYGGAIYNDSPANGRNKFTLSNVTFENNYSTHQGGAIYNADSDEFVVKDSKFIGNHNSDGYTGTGGAIYLNDVEKTTIDSSLFEDNYAGKSGGALHFEYSAGDINSNRIANSIFKNNTIHYNPDGSSGDVGYGAAIYANTGLNIEGSQFEGNNIDVFSQGSGGALYSYQGRTIIKNSSFTNNSISADKANGGAISFSTPQTTMISKTEFIGNKAISDNGGKESYGGAIFVDRAYNDAIIDISNSLFKDNQAKSSKKAQGGALYYKRDGNELFNITNTSFIGNSTVADKAKEARGGAVWSDGDINFIADNGVVEFTGNTATANGVKTDNAIYMENNTSKSHIGTTNDKTPTLSFSLVNNGKVILNDSITGASKLYNTNITGDSTGVFGLYNDITNSRVSIGNVTLNTINENVHKYNFNSLTLTGDTNFVGDVDLANEQMDRFTAKEYGKHTGNLNVVGMNLLSNAEKDVTSVYFAEPGLMDNVTINGAADGSLDLPTDHQITVLDKIFKYNVVYDKVTGQEKKDGGYFIFAKGDQILEPVEPDKPVTPDKPNKPIIPGGTTGIGGNTGNASDAYNPAVLAGPVASQLGAYSAINNALEHVFEHTDTFSMLPSTTRTAIQENNKYAITGGTVEYSSSDFNKKTAWVKPYAMFESVNLKNGPKTDVISYGTIVGGDGELTPMNNGWSRVGTLYLGYNGSSQSFSSVDTYQNGGLLGGTETYYKGNFWTALTATAGASVGETSTMYGHENFTSLMAGVANKTGYNLEFKEGRFIIQPTLMTSYTFVNTFDYTNAAGVKIDSDPLHVLQLHPHVKFIANTKNGWQPYARVGVVWNLMDKTNFTANDVKLPEMSIKPYVEYGVGVQKRWSDRFTAWGQAMVRNGGRTGIALSAGFRWSLGKDGSDAKTVNNTADKVVVKQLNGAASSAGEKTVLKQLKRPTTISLSCAKH